jgi:hypothetical protein
VSRVPADTGGLFHVKLHHCSPIRTGDFDTQIVLPSIEDEGKEIVADTIMVQERSREMPAQAKKKATKPKKVHKSKAPAKKKPALECGVCGYRVIVDETCGCAEEHVLVCCGQPMTKKKA